METTHKSVMANEVIDALDVRPSDTVVDATVGGAGHFAFILERLGESGVLIGIDADEAALDRAHTVVSRVSSRATVHIVGDNFRNLARVLDRFSIIEIDKVLFDLGWSSYQLVGRGLSFSLDEPLLMRYASTGTTAAEVVNTATEAELADILKTYGEERYAYKIARAIVSARKESRIISTKQLVAVIESAVPPSYRNGKIHPATKTFQALRIVVNDELGALREGLAAALSRLAPGGRVVVISFHSIEDRIVKEMFRNATGHARGTLVHKKPLTPSAEEISENRRARSAKLRVYTRHA